MLGDILLALSFTCLLYTSSLDQKQIFYLMSRGIPENEAKSMIVRGFAEPVAKELPLEYAVEMNNLIDMELEGANG